MADASPLSPATRRALIMLLRVGVGAVFVYAAYTKLRRPWMLFAFSINSYGLLPEWGVKLLARTLPWLELALGVLLLVGYGLRYVAAAATALLSVFFSVMLRAHFKGLGIDCGCFGFGEKLGARTLIRDGVLVALSLGLTVAAFVMARTKPPAEAEQDPR